MPVDPEIRKFAKLIAAHEKRLARLENGQNKDQLPYTSNENGTIPSYDENGELRSVWGRQSDGTFTNRDVSGPPPPQPTAPTWSPLGAAVLIEWDGAFAGGAARPADFRYVEVHAFTASGYVADRTTKRGVILDTENDGGQLEIPAIETLYVCLVAVSTTGARSVQSAEITAVPGPVVAEEVLDGIIDTVALAEDAVTQANIAAAAVGTAEIAGQSITLSELADGSVDASKILFNARDIGAVTTFRQPDAPEGKWQEAWRDDFTSESPEIAESYAVALSQAKTTPPRLTGSEGVVHGSEQGGSFALQDLDAADVDITVGALWNTGDIRAWGLAARVELPVAWGSLSDFASVLGSGYQLMLNNYHGVRLYRAGTEVASAAEPAFATGDGITIRLLVEGGSVRARWWHSSNPEPDTWAIDYTDPSPLAAGAAGFGVHNSGNRATTHLSPFVVTELVPPTPGDVWFDTNDKNKAYRWDGSTWQTVRDDGIAQALADAATAQDDAIQALSAAETAQATADGAIRTYYLAEPPWPNGSTQPDSVLGDLWYDLDNDVAHRWNGSQWTVIQDDAVATALAKAEEAQSTADGKIVSYFQPTEPAGVTIGDLWYDTDADNKAHWWDGTTWQPVPVGTEGISDDAIVASKVAAEAIGANAIAANSIVAGKIAADSVNTNELVAGSVQAAQIAAGAVLAGKIAAGEITTEHLNALAVTADKIAANSITAGKIDAGAVTAAKLAAELVVASRMESTNFVAGESGWSLDGATGSAELSNVTARGEFLVEEGDSYVKAYLGPYWEEPTIDLKNSNITYPISLLTSYDDTRIVSSRPFRDGITQGITLPSTKKNVLGDRLPAIRRVFTEPDDGALYLESWTYIDLASGFTYYDSWAIPKFYILPDGTVQLSGMIASSDGSGIPSWTALGHLPPEAFPEDRSGASTAAARSHTFAIAADHTGSRTYTSTHLRVWSTGGLVLADQDPGGPPGWISLDSVRFLATDV